MAEPIHEEDEAQLDFDAIVIGTGFAGAVTACRLTEVGKRICVLERGRRFEKDDFPVFPTFDIPEPESDEPPGVARERLVPDFSRLFWKMGHGLWDLRDLEGAIVAQAAGYGGGSLLYANVHLRPPADVFDAKWPSEYQGEKLKEYFDLAAYMLDVKPFPDKKALAKTARMESAARALDGEVHHFLPPLAINFAQPEIGQTGEKESSKKTKMRQNRYKRIQGVCKLKGECCFGCNLLAKNSLDRNYLARAEDATKDGTPLADIRTLAEVVSIEQIEGGYQVEYRDLLSGVPGQLVPITANYVFLCAGAVNSTELLLRSRLAGKLTFESDDLGKGFYPNVDTFGVAFDCREPQEANRGPTITSGLLYDDGRHWLLFQDGGMPTELEPLLGLFRSPLWLGRNRFWEDEKIPPPSSRHPRMGYAPLPFQSWKDALGSLTPSAVQSKRPLVHEATAATGRGPKWALLPEQFRDALLVHREQLIDEILADVDPFVADFMAETAGSVLEKLEGVAESVIGADGRFNGDTNRQATLEKLVEWVRKQLGIPTKSMGMVATDEGKLVEDLMRLGVQLVWGSQGDLVRSVANALLERMVPESGKLQEQTSHLVQWALDFRLSHGRTLLLLGMGRDSAEGFLSLVTPDLPAPGTAIRGESSRATGIVVHVSPPHRDGRAWHEASRGLLLAKLGDRSFDPGEKLLVGERIIGETKSGERELAPLNFVGSSGVHAALKSAAEGPRLVAIQFGAPSVDLSQNATVQRDLPSFRLRAQLPGPRETPERTKQERVLRDIVREGLGGELRSDPFWPFMRRRVTVHSQGGCPMGTVTDESGRVIGAPGLYVMDAAAFPGSVGVNPSATIAAIAEYKVERFIRSQPSKATWRATDFQCALKWANANRHDIDPIGFKAKSGKLPKSKPPRSDPIGIRFDEAMVGYCADPHVPSRDPKYRIETKLTATIDDLSCFLEDHRSGKAPRIALEGCVRVTAPRVPRLLKVRKGFSHIRLSRVHDVQAGLKTHRVEYRLVLDSEGESYVLEGHKEIRDDERFDVWEDATTVQFELMRHGKKRLEGKLRVPASTFFGVQIPSFKATNTKDPVRQSWALAAFAEVFFGHLTDVYAPELDRIVDVVKNIVERTHV